jgi:ribosomal-protein-alanine N-acetyltransferase
VTSVRLETARLLLRWFTFDDLAAYFELASNPRVIRYVGNQPVATLEAAKELMIAAPLTDYATYGYGRFACVWKESGEIVGFCGPKFLPDTQEVDLGYRFLPDFWGRGLATESSLAVIDYARNQLGLRRLVAWVHVDNVASARVLAKLGFSFEGNTTQPSIHGVTFDLYAKLLHAG